jgi:Xaa-Pro aminopeptidase
MDRFLASMDAQCPQWEVALILTRINQYYFSGTMQDGLLVVRRGQAPVYFVRKSEERALAESKFRPILPMTSYRDAAAELGPLTGTAHIETETVPLAMWQRLKRAFGFKHFEPMDEVLSSVRSVKSNYEIALMEKAGEIHRCVLEECVPNMLREGMSEAQVAAQIFTILVEKGHHGVTRFGTFGTEIVVGQIGFGENSLYPTCFDGPGGSLGLCAAAPVLGNAERRLRRGDLVFVDICCGVEGYHTDKTMTYMFRGTAPLEAQRSHRRCVEIQQEIASLLRPGNSPDSIYRMIMEGLDEDFLRNFMGYGSRRVKFLGHGIGLLTDEQPVIAKGFTEPLREGMAFALEPKKGITGFGMVGTENTFLVTPEGGRRITGNHDGLMTVD